MSDIKTGSLFSFPIQPITPKSFFKDITHNENGIDDFLFPKNLEENGYFNKRFADIESDSDTSDENDIPFNKRVELYEKQRNKLFQDLLNTKQPFQKIAIRNEAKEMQRNPIFNKKSAYDKLLKECEENSRSITESGNSFNDYGSVSSDTHESISESMSSSSRQGKHGRNSQKVLLNENSVDYQINTSWIQAVSLEADDEYLAWLQDLPTTPKKASNKKKVKTKDDEKLMLDPLEEARRLALAKQIEIDDEETRLALQTLEETPPPAPKSLEVPKSKKTMTAAEINEDWGFKDDEIGKLIFCAQCNNNDSLRKRKKKK